MTFRVTSLRFEKVQQLSDANLRCIRGTSGHTDLPLLIAYIAYVGPSISLPLRRKFFNICVIITRIYATDFTIFLLYFNLLILTISKCPGFAFVAVPTFQSYVSL